jgi:hypothetical protein
MPNVQISDLGISTVADADASLGGYLLQTLRLAVAPGGLNALRAQIDQPLSKVDLVGAHGGFVVSESTGLGESGAASWNFSAGANASLSIFNLPGDTVLSAKLFGPKTQLQVPGQDGAYVSFALRGQLGTGPSVQQGNFSFGVMAGGSIEAAYYLPLDASTPLGTGLGAVLKGFVIPARIEDLRKLPPRAAASIHGNGRIEFTVGGSLSVVPNPLAVTLPVINQPLGLQAGASVGFEATAAVVGEYELRIVGLGDGKVSLGMYRAAGASFDLSVIASAGVRAGVANIDLASMILGAVSGMADVDPYFLRKAGLSDGRIDDLRSTVRAAVNRKLAASLEFGFGSLKMDGPAFLFTLDLAALDDTSTTAVHQALKGDFRALTAGELAGVRLERSIAHETVRRSSRLRLNFFGIYNYASVFDLLRNSREVYDAASGEVLFIDEVTAKRRESLIENTKAIPTDRVAKLMADTLLGSLTLAASADKTLEATLHFEHWYFEYQRQGKPGDLKDDFDAAAALGLASPADSAPFLARPRFGRLALLVESRYDAPTARSVFFGPDGKPRPRTYFLWVGRRALVLLEAGDQTDGARALLGSDDKLFAALEDAGSHQAVLKELANANIPVELREQMYTDYLVIEWWADAMSALAEKLSKLKDAKDPVKARKELRERLDEVASRTKPLAGEPWGLVAMYLASQGRAEAHVKITTDDFVYERPEDWA